MIDIIQDIFQMRLLSEQYLQFRAVNYLTQGMRGLKTLYALFGHCVTLEIIP